MGIICGHKRQQKKSRKPKFVAFFPNLWEQVSHKHKNTEMNHLNVSHRENRESLLKVRVRQSMKDRVIQAALLLDLDQSTLVRLAVEDYLERHFPHGA